MPPTPPQSNELPRQELPTYSRWEEVPSHLKTKTQLLREGRKPGPAGQPQPRARIVYYHHRKRQECELFDLAESCEKAAPTPAQSAALEKARLALLTCRECKQIMVSRYDLDHGRCLECQGEIPPGPERRARHIAEVQAWARGLLVRDDWLIMDVETSDLYGDLIEIAAVRPDGSTAFESLVKPGLRSGEEEFEAAHIHGITRAMVADAPGFTQIEPSLRELLHGRTVLVYNASYDREILRQEVEAMHREALGPRPALASDFARSDLYSPADTWWIETSRACGGRAQAWVNAIKWQCAMKKYSKFVGEWSVRHKEYRFIGLGGGHRAAGDCRACLERIKEMAQG